MCQKDKSNQSQLINCLLFREILFSLRQIKFKYISLFNLQNSGWEIGIWKYIIASV